jgi:uncharacterized protein (DUF1697 family)
MPGVYIALLRGINVGGNNKLPMKDLAALFERAGCQNVSTYIQSGNVVFRVEAKLAKNLAETMNKAVLKAFKIDIPFIIRDAASLKKTIKATPYSKYTADPKLVHVGFLADKPTSEKVAALESQKFAPDEFQLVGQEVHFYFPKGMGKSKLTSQYFDSRLKTTITIRNWNTVTELLQMAEAL